MAVLISVTCAKSIPSTAISFFVSATGCASVGALAAGLNAGATAAEELPAFPPGENELAAGAIRVSANGGEATAFPKLCEAPPNAPADTDAVRVANEPALAGPFSPAPPVPPPDPA